MKFHYLFSIGSAPFDFGQRSTKALQLDNSTGHGLSFEKEIMKLHHDVVTVSNTNNGVQATLRWPRQLQLIPY